MADGHADIEQVTALLKQAIDDNASDVFLIPGAPVTFKVGETHQPQGERLTPGMAREHIAAIYVLAKRIPHYDEVPHTDDDFSFAIPGIGRFRLNVYYQRNTLAAVLRVIKFGLPDAAANNIPEEVMRCADLKQGLVLVTGPAGNGKSTTLACIVDKINETRCGHIITVEDPIEFVHNHKKSLVSQREIATDVESYELALASALRENPDVIMFGEMRTRSVIEVAMRAAETGQLMLSSLHTLGSAATITRIIDTFPAAQQDQARTQLSQTLEAIISQKLLPSVDGTERIPAFEIMFANPAIRNLIRENKIHQIPNVIQSSSQAGMRTFDNDLLRLYNEGKITKETVLGNCLDPDAVRRRI